MGKFLKILRYIANLIAIMGGCLSIEQNETPDSTRPLLGHQTEKSDFNPDQCVLSTRASNLSKVEHVYRFISINRKENSGKIRLKFTGTK